ncbi:MAG: hypothetical protein ACO3SO_10560, partial [Luteolibacter sp.]
MKKPSHSEYSIPFQTMISMTTIKRILGATWLAVLAILPQASAQEQPYNFATFLQKSELQIPNSYTPFGNYPEFSRFGDDGSRCVADP